MSNRVNRQLISASTQGSGNQVGVDMQRHSGLWEWLGMPINFRELIHSGVAMHKHLIWGQSVPRLAHVITG